MRCARAEETVVELYHCLGARSFRVLWVLEELGRPYRLRMLPFPPREKSPDFLERNPLGTVPLFVDGETRMTESVAICQYLSTRFGPTHLAPGVDDPAYGACLNWLHFGEATLTFPQTIVLRYAKLEPPERRLPQVADDYGRWFSSRLRVVDRAVSDRTWLCGNPFTLADVSVGYALLLGDESGVSSRFSPAIRAYRARLEERPAFRRAAAAEKREADAAGIGDTFLRATG